MGIFMERQLYNTFKKPGKEYRGKPFWAWNGELEKNELLKQIDVMKEMGFGGFFMHSRTGLETEYLGEDWFEFINTCSDYAKKEGLEAWLYDEDRWPSGSAGGIVTKEKQYRSTYLHMELYIKENKEDCLWENAAAVFAVTLKEGILLSYREVKEGYTLTEEELLAVFYIKESEAREVYNGYTYLDTMQKEAVENYIEVTHEKYKEKCKDRLGNSIQGIFTDEPHRGALFSTFSEGRENAVPFTPVLFEEFENRFGYDLKAKLPELFLKAGGRGLSKTTRDYIELCQELFLENFAVPLQNWISDENMLFTGHVLHEDSLTAQTVMQGSLMRFYEYMDYPGVDVLAEGNRCYWIVKQVVSVARQLNKKWILSELYGCTGWQMSLQDYKYAGDWQALFGITLRCPHLSWYTMKGEAKRDYPASIFHQSAWYKEYAYLEDYFSRIHVLMTEGKADCSLLVLNPIESVWARAYAGAFEVLSAREEEIQRLERQYEEVFKRLVKRRIDFDYGEEDIISRHARVENGVLMVGECSYRSVLVAGMDTMRSSTLNLIEEFHAQGGQLIFLGDAPEFVDVLPSDKAAVLAQKASNFKWGEDFESACASGTEIGVEGAAGEHILAQVRKLEEGRMVFLLNTERNTSFLKVRVDLGKGNLAELWDARTGDRKVLDTFKKDGRLHCFLDFEKAEEKLLMVDRREEAADNTALNGYPYRLEEDNICVLDMVTVITPSSNVIPKQEVLKADRCLRAELGYPLRSGEMLQPWYDKKFSSGKVEFQKIILRYDFYTEVIPAELSMAMEGLNQVVNMTINGQTINPVSCGKWIDICFDRIKVPAEFLVPGENILEITCDFERTGGIEAVYLLGNFGVSLWDENKRAVLTELPKTLAIGDITSQGLPFYSGKLSYLIDDIRSEDSKRDDIKNDSVRSEDSKRDDIKNDSVKSEDSKRDDIKNGSVKSEDSKRDDIKNDSIKSEDNKTDDNKRNSNKSNSIIGAGIKKDSMQIAENHHKRIQVSLGDFGGACVKLLGEEEQVLAFPPFQAEIAELKEIQLVLTRRNTFGPLHQLPAKAAAYGPDNFTTVGNQWTEGYVLLPQGLLTDPKITILE